MSGHSKWSTIKHKKGAADAKRGKIFSRIAKDIAIAASLGGGDVSGNPRLRVAMRAARAANMPMKNIENAIKKGTGDDGGAKYEEITYEGYGPGGSAFIVKCTTDNKNRTAAEIRHLFGKFGGNLGETGCVSYNFERKGVIELEADASKEDAIMMAALEAGADDVEFDGGEAFTVTTQPDDDLVEAVEAALTGAGLTVESSEVRLVPKLLMSLDAEAARKAIKMYDIFDDHEDVQSIATNFEVDDEVLAELAQ